ncbi:dTDP-4-amino-4,6-dideoxygalactose transaminase [Parvibacter caecicola]|uniref:dTDP-4-amino-4,6-dideoxygalactose transaminase n=1 Tax=Parvibacter caecicola TaxID=747645 RepID=UPI000F4478E5|nr:dTDP-4-amino-4,6-dideoxygalactose transaminase [Parvibacter caecicola]MCR2041971.1 dTDP-4-amino-4,6-dideoxygalactose transaminase [Parvibacter caecicola]RNL09806.1 dTDP-4-amino-4,6-dideoxygalactose transaminase [Parvibacter caecicola]
MIPFNVPPYVGTELEYVRDAVEKNRKICGDGPYTKMCQRWLEDKLHSEKMLLTTSGTTALEMAAMLCELEPGDEVILPSYTFSSTATAFLREGASLVFVDILPETKNIDPEAIEAAITERTKVVVPVHYAGVACDMDEILRIAGKYDLLVVEDAAQGVSSLYRGRHLGTIGDIGCFSFHETKNYSMGEGGAISVNNPRFRERADVIREKGTNRSNFLRGQVDKYTWVDEGSSFLPSDMNAAYLWGQLQSMEKIFANRMATWDYYDGALSSLCEKGRLELPIIPDGCSHNAHMYYVLLSDLEERTSFISFLKEKGVGSAFHYVPLHSAPAGQRFGRYNGEDNFTTATYERLVRLPLYYGMSDEDREAVVRAVYDYFGEGE